MPRDTIEALLSWINRKQLVHFSSEKNRQLCFQNAHQPILCLCLRHVHCVVSVMSVVLCLRKVHRAMSHTGTLCCLTHVHCVMSQTGTLCYVSHIYSVMSHTCTLHVAPQSLTCQPSNCPVTYTSLPVSHRVWIPVPDVPTQRVTGRALEDNPVSGEEDRPLWGKEGRSPQAAPSGLFPAVWDQIDPQPFHDDLFPRQQGGCQDLRLLHKEVCENEARHTHTHTHISMQFKWVPMHGVKLGHRRITFCMGGNRLLSLWTASSVSMCIATTPANAYTKRAAITRNWE